MKEGGVSFLGLLAITFIVLKIIGYINWSWIWVLSPLWAGAVLFIATIIFFVFITALTETKIIKKTYKKEKK